MNATRIPINDGANWLELMPLPEQPGTWLISDEDLTVKGGDWVVDATALGFNLKDDQAVNLDTGSDGMQCFCISSHVRVGEVHFASGYEGRRVYGSNDLNAIREAAQHIEFFAWCAGDV